MVGGSTTRGPTARGPNECLLTPSCSGPRGLPICNLLRVADYYAASARSVSGGGSQVMNKLVLRQDLAMYVLVLRESLVVGHLLIRGRPCEIGQIRVAPDVG